MSSAASLSFATCARCPRRDAPNARLIPDGFSDGGLADKVPEYTNIYWTLAGLRAAIESARWLGKADRGGGLAEGI